jgi:hypothetical protein
MTSACVASDTPVGGWIPERGLRCVLGPYRARRVYRTTTGGDSHVTDPPILTADLDSDALGWTVVPLQILAANRSATSASSPVRRLPTADSAVGRASMIGSGAPLVLSRVWRTGPSPELHISTSAELNASGINLFDRPCYPDRSCPACMPYVAVCDALHRGSYCSITSIAVACFIAGASTLAGGRPQNLRSNTSLPRTVGAPGGTRWTGRHPDSPSLAARQRSRGGTGDR